MLVTVTQGGAGDLVVHKAGCRHLARLPRADYTETFDAESVQEIAEVVYADHLAGGEGTIAGYADSLDVAPCVRLPTAPTRPGG